MLAGTIHNLASHPDNRTRMYRAELAGVTALDGQLEAPASPEPSVSATTTARSGRAASPGSPSPKPGAARKQAGSPAGSLQRCASPTISAQRTGGSTAAGDSGQHTTHGLTAALDSALTAAATLRPKAAFPLMGTAAAGHNEPDGHRAASPTHTLQQAHTLSRGVGISMARVGASSMRSRSPGGVGACSTRSRSTVAPDAREQFLLWMDMAFDQEAGQQQG